MSTVILIQIGKLYSKGVNAAYAQNTSRNIIADIGATLQFSGQPPFSCQQSTLTCAASSTTVNAHGTNFTIYAYCINTMRYSYILNSELSDAPTTTQTYHVLWKDTMTSNSSCLPLDITQSTPVAVGAALPSLLGSGSELVPLHMRLTRLYVQPLDTINSVYGIDSWVAYGDDDLLNVSVTNGVGCSVGTGSSSCAGFTSCRGGAGAEFCADSELSTIITRRLE
ncbi:MAG TPA: hypothetical protein VNE40_04515 [Candidatus Dormibacteraeota bacterium]|nr:hypothetical protein [Candidatus Dormibacteraeota bacterium]